MQKITKKTTTRISSDLFGQNIECVLERPDGDNSSAYFSLEVVEGGQVLTGGKIVMCGPIERTDLLAFLKAVVEEMELMQK